MTLSPRSSLGKQPLMTQASFSFLFQPPTNMFFFSILFVASFFLFFFKLLKCLAPYCSLSPAYWKRRVILPPERSWNLLQPKPDGCVHGAVRHSCSPPYDVHKSGSRLSEGSPPSSLPRLGLRFWVAPLLWQAKSLKKNWFLYLASQTCVLSECFRNADLEERTWCLLGEDLKKFGWSRAGPCSWCKFIHCEIQQDSSHEDVWLDGGLHPHKWTEGTETRLPRLHTLT